jgi:hypothetical protein
MNTLDLIKLAEMEGEGMGGDNEVTAAMMKELLAEAEGIPQDAGMGQGMGQGAEEIDPELLQAILSMSGEGQGQEMPQEAAPTETEMSPEIMQMLMSALGNESGGMEEGQGDMTEQFEEAPEEDSGEYTEDSTGAEEDDIEKEAMLKAASFLRSVGLA